MFPTSTGIHVVSAFFALSCVIASPFVVPRADNDGIHLAVNPNCGPLGGNTADVNAGIDLSKIKTIVSFGVRTMSRHPCPKRLVICTCLFIGLLHRWYVYISPP